MTDPKGQRLVEQFRALFAEKKYSMSPRHKAEADDWVERLECWLRDTNEEIETLEQAMRNSRRHRMH
jgi:hypothetical protein